MFYLRPVAEAIPVSVCAKSPDHRLKTAAQGTGFESLLAMKNSANLESVIVGIFDNSQDLARADERLAAAGFEGTVYDEAVVADEPGNAGPVGPVPVGPLLAPGVVPTEDSGGVARLVRYYPCI
jgi:hypothetical protein